MTAASKDNTSDDHIEIGDVRISFADRKLRRCGREERLQPRVLDVLQYLARHRGRIVPKEELIEAVWGDDVVGDESVHRCISKLRKLLGDDAREPEHIITVPKIGYKLTAYDAAPLPAEATAVGRGALFQRLFPPRFAAVMSACLLFGLVVLVSISLRGVEGGGANASLQSLTPYEQAQALYLEYDHDSNERAIEILLRLSKSQTSDWKNHAALAKAYAQKYARWTRDETDIENALRFAGLAIEDNAQAVESHWAQGIAQEYAGDLDKALSAYKTANRLDATIWQLPSNIGDIHAQKSEDVLAIEFYEKALAQAPQNLKIINKLGDANFRTNNIRKASFWFQSALAIDPLNDRASAGLAKLAIVDGDFAQAKSLCENVITRISAHANCRMEYGRALILEGQYDDAYAHFSTQRGGNDPKLASRERAYLLAAAIHTGRVTNHHETIAQFRSDLKHDAFLDVEERAQISGILNGEI